MVRTYASRVNGRPGQKGVNNTRFVSGKILKNTTLVGQRIARKIPSAINSKWILLNGTVTTRSGKKSFNINKPSCSPETLRDANINYITKHRLSLDHSNEEVPKICYSTDNNTLTSILEERLNDNLPYSNGTITNSRVEIILASKPKIDTADTENNPHIMKRSDEITLNLTSPIKTPTKTASNSLYDVSFKFGDRERFKEDTFERLLKSSRAQHIQNGNAENQDVFLDSKTSTTKTTNISHRRRYSFPSYSDDLSSEQNYTTENDDCVNGALFQSLLQSVHSHSKNAGKDSYLSERQERKGKKKIQHKKKITINESTENYTSDDNRILKRAFSDSTLNYKVEGIINRFQSLKTGSILKQTQDAPNLSTTSSCSQHDLFRSIDPPCQQEVIAEKSKQSPSLVERESLASRYLNVERRKLINMATSTPLLKTNSFSEEKRRSANDKENLLFNAQLSGVKPSNPQLLANNIELTPSMKSTNEMRAKFSVPMGVSNLSRCDILVPPTVLNFGTSPFKSSVDMFEDVSTRNKNVLENAKNSEIPATTSEINPFLHDKNRKIITAVTMNELRRTVDNKEKKDQNSDFKIPIPRCHSDLIVVQNGGKKWRRSIMIAPNKRSCNNVLNESKSIGTLMLRRKSSVVIECKEDKENFNRSDNEPNIVEVSLQEANHNNSTPIKGREHNEVGTSNRTNSNTRQSTLLHSLNRSKVMNRSSSYVVPLGDGNEPIREEASFDIWGKVLDKCSKNEIIQFDTLFDEKELSTMRKLGEGSFGEVFQIQSLRHLSPSVLKIVPIGGKTIVNNAPQTKLTQILAEIIVSTDLGKFKMHQSKQCGTSQNSNFIDLRSCMVVEGDYPEELLRMWDDYDEEKGSENDRPESRIFNDESSITKQRFAALEYENGGKDLENIVLHSGVKGLAVFLQVAHALAVAEEVFKFEHRDLHWGNILVRECSKCEYTYTIRGNDYQITNQGVHASIIDYSLSRMTTEDGSEIYNNLAEDPDLFICTGDYQFDIYRKMQEHTNNEWSRFYPKTNIFWMHYLLVKLINEVHYNGHKKKGGLTTVHKQAVKELKRCKEAVESMNFKSCYEFVEWHRNRN